LRHDVRIFALDRIKSIVLTDETFDEPEKFNIDDFMRSSFGVFHGEPLKVRIWFAAEIAEYIREKVWHESQNIEPQPDGAIIFEAEVAGTKEIEAWVLKWGANAKVLAPESLRDQIHAEVEAMRKAYLS
jgi:predicted DNA-binding transcriptional regulator YafY